MPERDLERAEEKRLEVLSGGLCHEAVDLGPFVVKALELLSVPRERPAGAADPRPGRVDIDLDPGDEGSPREVLTRRLGEDRPAAECDHGCGAGQRLGDDLLLEPAELRLASLEELADRAEALLDHFIRVDEGALRKARELAPETRLAGPHEADEGEVSVYRADHGMRSR